MAMSRRKQLHPKSLKDGDETIFVLPDELKCGEDSNDIVARVDIERGHSFGPFPAITIDCQRERLPLDSDSTDGSNMTMQVDAETVEHQIQQLQLLDNRHNWLVRCSTANKLSVNLDINFQDDQITAIVNQTVITGTRLNSNRIILPKLSQSEDSQTNPNSKINMINAPDDIKVKEEPVESDKDQERTDLTSSTIKSESPNIIINSPKSKEIKKLHPLIFTCNDCGIRYSNRSTLDAHRQHYCAKRETTKSHLTDSTTISGKVKSMKRKYLDRNELSPSPTKRLSLPSKEMYCTECDILFSKPDSLLQHKLHYCRTNPTASLPTNEHDLSNSFRPPVPFDRPIQIGQFIYVPVPIVSSQMETNDSSLSPPPTITTNDNLPLDLSKPKKSNDESDQQREKSINVSTSPLDLTIEKTSNSLHSTNTPVSSTGKSTNVVQQQIYECDYCSIRFSSLKTLHAHQENYCIEYRKHKAKGINNNNNSLGNTSMLENKSNINDINRCQSPPISRTVSLSPNESINTSHIPPHRSSPFMCRLCKYRGNTLRGMRMHFKFHLSNNEPCSDDDIIITSTINNTLSVSSPQLLLKCTICSAMFDHEDTLINHIKCVHTKESLLECLECQSRFCSKWNLIRHMKLTHTNMKCDDEEVQHQNDNDEHISSNESPFIINGSNNDQRLDEDRDLSSSNDKSSDPVNLTRNILIESMDLNSMKKTSDGILIKKKFACPYCHIKFGSIDTLKQHMSNYCSSRPKGDEQINAKKKSTDTFCSSCQIPFRHKSSFDAHKMYYCRGSNKAHVKMQA